MSYETLAATKRVSCYYGMAASSTWINVGRSDGAGGREAAADGRGTFAAGERIVPDADVSFFF